MKKGLPEDWAPYFLYLTLFSLNVLFCLKIRQSIASAEATTVVSPILKCVSSWKIFRDKMEQFKILTDLRDFIKTLEAERGKVLARPIPEGGSPVFYRQSDVPTGRELIHGVQICDFCFSPCKNWVLPHNQMGLSFSANWKHLKSIYKLKSSKNPGKNVDVYWVLEKADLPPDLAFIPDKNDDRHYLLTVTKKMTVESLVSKLKWVSDRMAIIKDGTRAIQ
jgi:hypothetical protein